MSSCVIDKGLSIVVFVRFAVAASVVAPRGACCRRASSTRGCRLSSSSVLLLLLLSWLLEEPVVVVRHRQGVVDCRLRPFCCYCFCRGS